ncbi:MAG TPA: hypothetical protein VHO70_14330 [Chitinispirillaceae bacterium]|nr:hypothetical protein [Chitinispirillaceae bacterium]
MRIPEIILRMIITLTALFYSVVSAQVDDFSEEEANHFREQKIYPLVAREQDGDYPRSTYLIPHDITVPRGKVLTLYPGSTLLFKKDTRLIIKGKLIAKGKVLNPVLFCKLENGDYYTPVDSMVDTKWDGIFVEDSGRIEFQYSHITNSKYGVVLEGPVGDITLDSVQFYENRYQNLKVGEKEVTVATWKNVFYQETLDLKRKLTAKVPDTIYTQPQLIKREQRETPPGVRKFRAVMWTGMVVGIGAGVGGYFLADVSEKNYDNVKAEDIDKKKKIARYRFLTRLGEGLKYGGPGLAGGSLIGLTISLAF